MYRLALASASPRRLELLTGAGYAFSVIESPYEEDMTLALDPPELARVIAEGKARAAAAISGPDKIVLAADTIVVAGASVLGKPRDAEDASRMLGLLSGAEHEVITGYAVIDNKSVKMTSGAVITRVRFRPLGEAEIAAYVASGEPMGKAGAYAIQGGAAKFVESVDGPLDNVIGLPLKEVGEALREFGIVPVSK